MRPARAGVVARPLNSVVMQRSRPSRPLRSLVLLLAAAMTTAEADPEVTIRSEDGNVKLMQSRDGKTLMLKLRGRKLPIGECGTEQLFKTGGASFVALVEERNCGATVDFATRVVLDADGAEYVVVVFAGRPRIELSIGAGGLLVKHSPVPDDQTFARQSRIQGLAIAYEVQGEAVGQTPQESLDFASLNFGATGRAVGIPGEALLRVAGWSQIASGLWRTEWGQWNESAPYGDDPAGTARVLEGITCYEVDRCAGK